MTKARIPLFSFSAIGQLTKSLSFRKRGRLHIAEEKPIPTDAKSLAQLSWRHMYQKAVALWHALSADEQNDWESQARRRHMTGFAWFMSQCLKPNPGLYLPLQGGIMQGNIDIAKNRLLRLPAPTDGQEPDTLAARLAAILAHKDDPSAHHAKYTDDEVAAIAAALILTHEEDASAHHTKTPTSSGEYTGDSTEDRGIPHGLGVIPHIVFLHKEWAYWYRIQRGINRVLYNVDGMDSAGQIVDAMDATNFYVGNPDDYALSANLSGLYRWVAIG